ncbi:hypothetical protein B9Z55_017276 [Caenorhabditis nigoni]|nr:hypothetical protein B9Z55_017276 [Caenorhabditis nigoni]
MFNKCAPLEHELAYIRNNTVSWFSSERNMTDLCQKITNCYGTIKCQESKDKIRIVKEKCEEIQYTFGGVPKCLEWIVPKIMTFYRTTCLSNELRSNRESPVFLKSLENRIPQIAIQNP